MEASVQLIIDQIKAGAPILIMVTMTRTGDLVGPIRSPANFTSSG